MDDFGSSTDLPITMSAGDSESSQNEESTSRMKKIIIWKDRNHSVQLLKVNCEQESLSMDYLDDKDPDLVYAQFLHAYHCYDLIPTSSKLVVLDTTLNLRRLSLLSYTMECVQRHFGTLIYRNLSECLLSQTLSRFFRDIIESMVVI